MPDRLHADRLALERAGVAEHAALFVDAAGAGVEERLGDVRRPCADRRARGRQGRSRTARHGGGSACRERNRYDSLAWLLEELARRVVGQHLAAGLARRAVGDGVAAVLTPSGWCRRTPGTPRRPGRAPGPGGPPTSSCRCACVRRRGPRRPPRGSPPRPPPRRRRRACRSSRTATILARWQTSLASMPAECRRSCAGRAGSRARACCAAANGAASDSPGDVERLGPSRSSGGAVEHARRRRRTTRRRGAPCRPR